MIGYMTKHTDSLILRVTGRAPFDKVLWASDGVRRIMYYNPVGKTVSEIFGGYVFAENGLSRSGQLVRVDNCHYIVMFTDIGLDDCMLAILFPVASCHAEEDADAENQLDEEVRKKTIALNQAVNDLELHRKKLSHSNRIAGAGNFEYLSDQRCVVLTPEACQVIGFENEKTVVNIDEICSRITDKGFHRICDTLAEISEHTKIETEISILDDAGGERHIKVVMHKLSQSECVFDGVFYDITFKRNAEKELRKQEAFYRTLYNRANIGIFTMDREGFILDCNQYCLKLTGYELEDVRNRKSSDIFILPEDRAKVSEVFRNLENTLNNCGSIDYRIRTKNGHIIHVLTSFELLVTDDETRVFCFLNDISGLKSAQEKNIEQERMLLQQSKMATMGEMVGIIAHQWVQPLNSIAMISQMLEELLELDADSQKLVHKTVVSINEQIEFMTATINDFRNFLKPMGQACEFNVFKAVSDVLQLYRPQLKYYSIKCGIYPEGEEAKRITVFGYENEFKNVILNLLTNARDALEAKFAEDGEIDITVGRRGDRVVIAVSDNGGGISSEMLGKIFTAYSSTKGEKGTGLGLYMSRLIICERMHGNINAENTGLGAKISVTLNVCQA